MVKVREILRICIKVNYVVYKVLVFSPIRQTEVFLCESLNTR